MIELAAVSSDSARIGVAGDTYNTAVYLRRLTRDLEVDVGYITAVGDDRMSDRILGHMRKHDLDVECVIRRAGQTPGLYSIDTDDVGERTFSYWRANSAARQLFQPPMQLTEDDLLPFDLIYLSGISMAILPSESRQTLIDWLCQFRKSGGLVAYDSNFRAALWENSDIARDITTIMWDLSDIALPSLDDEMALFGDGSETDVLDRLASIGANCGALKRGDAGPIDLASGGLCGLNCQAVPSSQVVDTTAAGDSFNAGWLAGFIASQSPSQCMALGHELACEVVQARGAIVDTDLAM